MWLSGCRTCSGGSSGRSGTVRTWRRFNSTSGGTLTEVNGINLEIFGGVWYNVTREELHKNIAYCVKEKLNSIHSLNLAGGDFVNKKPQVQIDEDLFLDLLRFFGDDCSDVHLQESINVALSDKVDKLIARKLFSEYKQAPTPEQREEARQRYLDHAQISPAFRSSSETSF